MIDYLNLKIGALARLCILRNRSAYTRAADVLMPPSLILADWRAARVSTFRNASGDLSQGFNDSAYGPAGPKTPVWYCDSDAGPFRKIRKAHEITRTRHTGWFADAHQENTIVGIVAYLSHSRYVAGYLADENDEHVYFDRIYTDEREAADAADDHARIQADKEREYSEQWEQARNLAEEIEEKKRDIAELFTMRHHARARRELRAMLETVRTKRADLVDNYSDFDVSGVTSSNDQ